MTDTAPTTGYRVHVRPKYSLLSNAFAAIGLATAPVFAVAYWFAASRGGIEFVAIANVVVVAIGLLLLWRQLRIFAAVTETELIGNGIFTRLVRVPLADITEVRLVPTYQGAAPDPTVQLLVTGAGGRRLFRMRGNFWHEGDLKAIAAALPLPLETVADPLTMHDFFRAYPGSAYWFEDRRLLQILLIAAAALVAFAAALGIMLLLGLPVRFL
ncbi:hypothetical protein [Protaetiibacter larvae]|uniref:PH domain-containing protein n=1 Tax=Protaetiibacter larvae TaxID=2592654 RepID=A0A5C1Y4N7_9MICO|nr:hypothetical protein [Protaetiibacter larvae]QEO08721.1 hypothetical protein FLP23_01000 [Protaetiibacter larvae]